MSSGSWRQQFQNVGLARCLTVQCSVPLADPQGLRPLARPAAPKRRRLRSGGPTPQHRTPQTTPEMRRVRPRRASEQPPRSRLRCSSTTVYSARLRLHNGTPAPRGRPVQAAPRLHKAEPYAANISRYTSNAALPNSTKIACSSVVSGRARCLRTSRMAISAAGFCG